LTNKFIETLKESIQSFNYHTKPPKLVRVRSKIFADWEQVLRDSLTPHDIAAILILPGTKGVPNPLYDDIKRLLLVDIPVPSQVILSSSIEQSKSALFNLCNKVLI
jgi:hypothetical protein